MGFQAAAIGLGVLAFGNQVHQGRKAAAAQRGAQAQAVQQSQKTAKQADIANNRANKKKPNTSAILASAQQAGRSGQSGTLLTGAQGVDQSSLSLGKSTLLGG